MDCLPGVFETGSNQFLNIKNYYSEIPTILPLEGRTYTGPAGSRSVSRPIVNVSGFCTLSFFWGYSCQSCFCDAFIFNGSCHRYSIQIIWRPGMDAGCVLRCWCCSDWNYCIEFLQTHYKIYRQFQFRIIKKELSNHISFQQPLSLD